MSSVQFGCCAASEISGKRFDFRSKNLFNSNIQLAGLCASCITKPSCDSSDALLEAAMDIGAAFASKKKIKQAPRYTQRLSSNEIAALPATECAICLCNIEVHDDDSNGTALRLGCGHVFHPDCIMTWLPKHSSCPTCRWQCKKMRHPKVKAAAQSDDDGWIDQPLQPGDAVSIDCSGDHTQLLGKVVQAEDCYGRVVVELRQFGGFCELYADEVNLLSDEAFEAATAQFGRFSPCARLGSK
jgi:hypothetical protein